MAWGLRDTDRARGQAGGQARLVGPRVAAEDGAGTHRAEGVGHREAGEEAVPHAAHVEPCVCGRRQWRHTAYERAFGVTFRVHGAARECGRGREAHRCPHHRWRVAG